MATEQPATSAPLVSSGKDDSLIATCHCGRVTVQLPSKPTILNECQCTACYKYGALWAYFPRADVVVTTAADTKLEAYMRDDQGEAHLSFNRCGHCGCMICWLGERKSAGISRMGVNCRMLPKNEIDGIEREVTTGP